MMTCPGLTSKLRARRILGMIHCKFYHLNFVKAVQSLCEATPQLLFIRVGSATGQRPRGTGIGSKVCPDALL